MEDNISYLLNHGMQLDELQRLHDRDGLSYDEIRAAAEWRIERGESLNDEEEQHQPTDFFSCFKTLDEFEEQEAEWTVYKRIPKGQISTIASDGGVGKTSTWINILAPISAGKPCFLDPPDCQREPQLVAFLTTEDSVRKKLKRKLREAGANMANIIAPDFSNDRDGFLRRLKFGSQEMELFVRHYRPSICIFDPIQSFIPPTVNMASRNAMRDCLAPLVALGEETGMTTLLIGHTNKRKGAYGRDRMADSADIWDISRSVLMLDFTETQGVRYLSHEKSNYSELQETVLFTIDDKGIIHPEGTSWKRDREYQQETAANTAAPARQDCKEWIIEQLESAGGSMQTKELETAATAAGFSFRTLRRAKDELKTNSEIRYFQIGGGRDKTWFIERITLPDGWGS